MKKIIFSFLIPSIWGILLFSACGSDENSPTESEGINIADLVETDNDLLGVSDAVPQPYADAISSGGKVVNLEPMSTFFVLWVPDGYESLPARRTVVIAHGHGGNAYREMALEMPFARENNYAIVTIQWGEVGGDEKMFSGKQFYEFMDVALQYMEYKYKSQLDKCAYRGWSLGSEISYEVTYLDRANGKNRLALTISHDGGLKPDPNDMAVGKEFATNLYNGVYGDSPFAGAHFYLYAGDVGNIGNNRNTQEVITAYGGTVVRLIEDNDAGHDGFYIHPQYHEDAIEIFIGLTP